MSPERERTEKLIASAKFKLGSTVLTTKYPGQTSASWTAVNMANRRASAIGQVIGIVTHNQLLWYGVFHYSRLAYYDEEELEEYTGTQFADCTKVYLANCHDCSALGEVWLNNVLLCGNCVKQKPQYPGQQPIRFRRSLSQPSGLCHAAGCYVPAHHVCYSTLPHVRVCPEHLSLLSPYQTEHLIQFEEPVEPVNPNKLVQSDIENMIKGPIDNMVNSISGTIHAQIGTLQSRVSNLNDLLDDKERVIRKFEEEVRRLRSRQTSQAEIEQLKAQVAELTEKCTAVEQSTDQLEEQHEHLKIVNKLQAELAIDIQRKLTIQKELQQTIKDGVIPEVEHVFVLEANSGGQKIVIHAALLPDSGEHPGMLFRRLKADYGLNPTTSLSTVDQYYRWKGYE